MQKQLHISVNNHNSSSKRYKYKRALVFLLGLVFSHWVLATGSVDHPPFDLNQITPEELIVSDLSKAKVIYEKLKIRAENESHHLQPASYFEDLELSLNLKEVGTYQKLKDGRSAWSITLISEGADEVFAQFKYDVPEGSEFLVYAGIEYYLHDELKPKNLLRSEDWITMKFQKDSLTFVYVEPATPEIDGEVIINKLFHVKKAHKLNPALNACESPIVCDQGDEPARINGDYWGDVSQAIVKIEYYDVSLNMDFYCTGFLINNFVPSEDDPLEYAPDDKTSYIVTADHCADFLAGGDYGQVYGWNHQNHKAFLEFNYLSKSCTDDTPQPSAIFQGISVVMRSNDNFDFQNYAQEGRVKQEAWENRDIAVLVPGFQPDRRNLYEKVDIGYLGWDMTVDDMSYPAAIIGHPIGKPQRLVTYNALGLHNIEISDNSYQKPDTAKLILANEFPEFWIGNVARGFMEQGISGGPLLDAKKRARGVMSQMGAQKKGVCPHTPTDLNLISAFYYNHFVANQQDPKSLIEMIDPLGNYASEKKVDGYFPHKPNNIPEDPPFAPAAATVQYPIGNVLYFKPASSNGNDGYGDLDTIPNPEVDHCSNGVKDVLKGEEWVDCGGVCGACDHDNYCYADLSQANLVFVDPEKQHYCLPNNSGYLGALIDNQNEAFANKMRVENYSSSCEDFGAFVKELLADTNNPAGHQDLFYRIDFDYGMEVFPRSLWKSFVDGEEFNQWDPDINFPFYMDVSYRLVELQDHLGNTGKNVIGGSGRFSTFPVYLDAKTPVIVEDEIQLCVGEPVALHGVVPNEQSFHWLGSGQSYLSSTNELEPIFNPLQPGDYTLELVSYINDEHLNKCDNSDFVNIVTIQLEPVEVPKLEVGVGEELELPAPFTGDEGKEDKFSYAWTSTFNLFQSDERNPIWEAALEPENNFKFTVAVDGPGEHDSCNSSFELWVDIKDGACHVVATAMSFDTVKVTWQDCTGDIADVNKYFIERWIDGTWQPLGHVPGDQLHFWDYDVPVGTEKVYYKVVALKQDPQTNQNIGLASSAKSEAISMESLVFTEHEWNNTGHEFGNISFADVDDDNDLDHYFSMFFDVEELPDSRFHINDGEGFAFSNWIQNSGLPKETFSVTSWGDYNQDGHPDALVSGGLGSENLYPTVYRSNGDDTFTKVFEADDELLKSGLWGDFNGDDRLDFLVTGCSGTKIYYQQPMGLLFNGVDEGLPSINVSHTISSSGVAAGDMDNDGDLDLLFMGTDCQSNNPRKWQYQNEGLGNWSLMDLDEYQGYKVQSTLKNSAVAFGDYNADGLLDLVIAGENKNGALRTEIYRKPSSFEHYIEYELVATLPGVKYPHLSWADYDNDGDLDLLVGGENAQGVSTQRLYKNLGDNEFDKLEADLGTATHGHAWADLNNDGVLDLYTSQTYYLNNMPDNAQTDKVKNTPPNAPAWMGSYVEGNDRVFVWAPGSDESDETPVEGLSYDLRIWNPNTQKWVRSGSKHLVGRGDIQGTSWRLEGGADLPQVSDWEVATVDTGYTKSDYLVSNNVGEPPMPEYELILPDPDDYALCQGVPFHVEVQPKEGQVGPAPYQTDFIPTDATNTVESLTSTKAKVVRHQVCDEPYCYLEITADLQFDGIGSQQLVGGIDVPGKNGIYDTVTLEWLEHEGSPAVQATLLPPTNGGKKADHIYWLTPPEGIVRIGDYHSDNLIFQVEEGYGPETLCDVKLVANATHSCGPDGNFYASAVYGTDPITLVGEVHMTETADIYGQVHISWELADNLKSIIVMREASEVNQSPMGNVNYNASTVFGQGDDLGEGNYIVFQGVESEVTVTGMTPGMHYEIKQFVYRDDLSCYPADYYDSDSASVDLAACPVWDPLPVEIDVELLEMNPGSGQLKISWTPDAEREWVVLMREDDFVDKTPVWGNDYTASLVWEIGEDLGDQTYVMYQGNDSELTVTGLTPGAHYEVKVFGSREGIPGCYSNDYAFGSSAWASLSLADPEDDQESEAASYSFSEPQGAYEAVCNGGLASLQLQQTEEGVEPESIVYAIENAISGQISGQNTQNVKTYNVVPTGLCELPPNSCGMATCYSVNAELTFNINDEITKQYVSKEVAAHCGPCEEGDWDW